MTARFRTALIGAGRMGSTYADDPLTRRHFRYASHAEVLAQHPAFLWEATVDSDESALADAQARWGFAHRARSAAELVERYEPEVLVLATPPAAYYETIKACPGVKAVLCEKPLGNTQAEARAVFELCEARGILLQVNYWRRCDPFHVRLASGALSEIIGKPSVINGLYGNGLHNNGSHLVDVCRMLFGEIESVSALGPLLRKGQLAFAGDFDVACALQFASGAIACLQPVDFKKYREVGLDIWGETGRLEILNEGLTNRLSRISAHRALTGAREVAVDTPEMLASTVGEALFHVYGNLAAALNGQEALRSPGISALHTAAVVDAIALCATSGDGQPQPVQGVGSAS